jgi:hypothetical protein
MACGAELQRRGSAASARGGRRRMRRGGLLLLFFSIGVGPMAAQAPCGDHRQKAEGSARCTSTDPRFDRAMANWTTMAVNEVRPYGLGIFGGAGGSVGVGSWRRAALLPSADGVSKGGTPSRTVEEPRLDALHAVGGAMDLTPASPAAPPPMAAREAAQILGATAR